MKYGAVLAVCAALVTTLGCAAVRMPAQNAPCPGFQRSEARISELERLAGEGTRIHFSEAVTAQSFVDHYFAAFDHHQEALSRCRWPWLSLPGQGWLLENLRPASSQWFAKMDTEAAWERFGSIGRPGIALATTALRAMPASRPLIRDPGKPGQGFAFDQIQTSLVNADEPLWLSHRSSSGRWTFVFTSYASGWIRSRDVAPLPDGFAASWRRLAPLALVVEGFPLRSGRGDFLFTSRIGMILPLVEETADTFKVLVAVTRSRNGEAVFEMISIPTRIAVRVPMAPTVRNVATIASRMLGLPYGWGGQFGNRDCSAMIRDFFMPFGLWLPRHSREQAAVGRVIDLSGFDERRKAQVIVAEGVSYATLVAKRGHIALYVGHRGPDPVVLHAVWDIPVERDGRRGREHVGQIVLTTLRRSKAAPSCGSGTTLLHDLESMNTLSFAPPTRP